MDQHAVIVKDPYLKPLEKVLDEWIKCTLEYIEVWEGDDLPYWYNERANVSILAGAAWRSEMTAIEEYQSEKETSTKNKFNGRNDIYIADKKHGFAIEAKFVSPEIKKEKLSCVGKAIEKAIDDTKNLRDQEIKVAAVFVAPHSEGRKASKKEVVEFISKMNEFEPHAQAWCFPEHAQKPKNVKKNYHPAIVVLLFRV